MSEAQDTKPRRGRKPKASAGEPKKPKGKRSKRGQPAAATPPKNSSEVPANSGAEGIASTAAPRAAATNGNSTALVKATGRKARVPYSEELAEKIFERLRNGETVRAICRRPGMPRRPALIRQWAMQDAEFGDKYQRARELGCHAMADEILDFADNKDVDAGAVARDRLKIDTRRWLLARILPNIFGDRVEAQIKRRHRRRQARRRRHAAMTDKFPPAPTFVLTEKRRELNRLLASEATHILAWGGSRSGKTFTFCRAIAVRAMKAPGSRHLVARFRFNHVVQSIWHDTLPKVMATCFPTVEVKEDKASWFWEFPNGSQIWFGGLDDRERTEKVLGLEFATVLLNEVSQISLAARNLIVTRLAQNIEGLALKCYLDCDPPVSTHWCHRLFLEKREGCRPTLR